VLLHFFGFFFVAENACTCVSRRLFGFSGWGFRRRLAQVRCSVMLPFFSFLYLIVPLSTHNLAFLSKSNLAFFVKVQFGFFCQSPIWLFCQNLVGLPPSVFFLFLTTFCLKIVRNLLRICLGLSITPPQYFSFF
jgi:hypothetical protein